MSRYIYVVFSSTPYFIGKAIRRITGQVYNHASIALDPELTQMYSFARRHYRTPLYGGFVKESLSRFRLGDQISHIRISKIPVTQEQYDALADRLAAMEAQSCDYLYNHISALGALLHKPIYAKNAYTCVEFCVEILSALDLKIQPGRYYSVDELDTLLSPYRIYTGQAPEAREADPVFFAKRPVPFPLWVTARDICKLLPRLGK